MLNITTIGPATGARFFSSVLRLALLAAIAFPAHLGTDASAKTPGSTYCFYKTCHRVKTIAETQALIGKEHTLPASFYDDCKSDRYNPCGLTSSGEVFRPSAPDNAASPIYPDGTKLLVWSPASGRALVLRINNAGPYWGNRTLDVSRAAAETLGFKSRGVANLKARILEAPSKADATYNKHRSYEHVPGDIGVYETFAAASAAHASLQMIASATLAPFNGGALPAELLSDDARTPAVAVAQAVPQRKMSREALADASAMTGMRWPVVQAGPSKAPVKTAALTQQKADVAPKRRSIEVRKVAKPDARADVPAEKRKTADVKTSSAKKQMVRSERIAPKPAKRSDSVIARSDNTVTRNEGRVVSKSTAMPSIQAAQASHVLPGPNDISVFSRYNPDAPVRKLKQASAKSAWLRASARPGYPDRS